MAHGQMNLTKGLLKPGSIALIGASDGKDVAGVVTTNLLTNTFDGNIFLVHLNHSLEMREGYYNSVADLPVTPDLAIISCTANLVVDALNQAGHKGIKTAVIVTDDPDGPAFDTPFKNSLRESSRFHGCRFIGPGSAGLNMPLLGLNASWIRAAPPKGRLALISQSASMAASVVGWALSRRIGLSRVISVGDEADIGIDDILNVLAADMQTTGILLSLHSVKSGLAFLSAARAASRIKPIFVLKPHADSSVPIDETTVDPETIYDAAFKRAGLLTVRDTEEWFDAAENLTHARLRRKGLLAILANGNGPAFLAAGPVAKQNLLARFQDKTVATLQTLIPNVAAGSNPLVLGLDATAEEFAHVLGAVKDDSNVAAVLVVYSPSPTDTSRTVAQVIASIAKRSELQISVCWFGISMDDDSHAVLVESKVAIYELPEKAADAYVHREKYRRKQETLRQIPATLRRQFTDEIQTQSSDIAQVPHALMLTDETESHEFLRAYGMIWRAIKAKRSLLDEAESSAVLQAFGFVIPDERHDSHSGHSLALAVMNDPVFGRFIVVRAAGQSSVALPPLNSELSRQFAIDTQTILQIGSAVEYSLEAIQSGLIRLANLAVQLPEIVSIELFVVGADEKELVVRPGRILVSAHERTDVHLSIQPYPQDLEERVQLKNGQEILVRPIRIEDLGLYHEMLNATSKESLFLRFCHQFGDIAQAIPTDLLANLMHFNYSRDMTFIAVGLNQSGAVQALGVADVFVIPGFDQAEFSILITSDLSGTGLGKKLMMKVIDYCRAQGLAAVFGLVLRNNKRMLGLCSHLGFVQTIEDEEMFKVILTL